MLYSCHKSVNTVNIPIDYNYYATNNTVILDVLLDV